MLLCTLIALLLTPHWMVIDLPCTIENARVVLEENIHFAARPEVNYTVLVILSGLYIYIYIHINTWL